MNFARDIEAVLGAAVALINTRHNGVDSLDSPQAVSTVLSTHEISDALTCSRDEYIAIANLREELRVVWEATDIAVAVEGINSILKDSCARPRLVMHDGWDWHMHFGQPGTPLDVRVRAELGMGLAEVVRQGEIARLRVCQAPDCDAVLLDLSRNRSRLYCDTGNCGNRLHVAAYRHRTSSRERSR